MEIISENNIANNSQIKNNKVICIDYSYCNKYDKMEFGELFTALIGIPFFISVARKERG